MLGPCHILCDHHQVFSRFLRYVEGTYNLHSIAILLFDISYKNDVSLPHQKFTNLLCWYCG
jgi:hypothetical protein